MPILTKTTHLRLHGRLDGPAVTELRDALAEIVRGPAMTLMVDLSGVTLIDGAGVGALAFLFRRLTASGRKLHVTGVTGQPLAFLRDLGLTETLGLPVARKARWVSFFGQTRAA